MTIESTGTFEGAGRAASRRLALAGWLELLGRSGPIVFLCAAAVVAVLRLRSSGVCGAAEAALFVLLWGGTTALWAWLRRPDSEGALAFWDRRADRREMFLSAYCFERERTPTVGQRLHLSRAYPRLRKELVALPTHIPLRLRHIAWLLPLAFVVFCASGLLVTPPSADDIPVGADSAARAKDAGLLVGDLAKELAASGELSEEEREQLEDLKKSLDESARKMQNLEDETPRDVLKELERKAREAEKLAESLGADASSSLSSDVISELERHADTAAMASALRAKNLEGIANEAEKLAKKLDRKELTIDEQERMKEALKRALKQANEKDRESFMGKQLKRTLQQLQKKQPKNASRQLSKISKRMRRTLQRMNTKRQLQRLASSLRSQGQKIFGQNQRSLTRLGRIQGVKLQKAGKGGSGKSLPLGRIFGIRKGSQAPPGSRGPKGYILGQNPPPGAPRAAIPVPGTGGMPMPGGGSMPGGMGGTPVPGSSPGAQQGAPAPAAGTGGHQAGHGSAPYSHKKTQPHKATSTGVVAPPPTGDGASEVRYVPGSEHTEAAGRSAQELAVDFIRAEEEALSEEPLPLSRRQQILRYFTALRRRIENE
jgi:hypothetical protein